MITALFSLAFYTNASLEASFCASDAAWRTTQLSLLLASSLRATGQKVTDFLFLQLNDCTILV